MNDTVIYRHIKPCGEVFYIGIGNERRPYNKKHRSDFWKRVVKKYPDYEVQVLKSDLSWEEACELEKILIAYYGRKDLGLGTLVNMTNGGDGVYGLIHSEETKQKMSAVRSGKNHPMYGKKHSEETLQKISAANQNPSKETREKIGAAHKGKKLSKEHRQKMSNSMKGKNSGKNNPMYNKPAPNRKLTFKQAKEIRQSYKTKKTSHRKLAQEYGVGKSTITSIINNKRYTK